MMGRVKPGEGDQLADIGEGGQGGTFSQDLGRGQRAKPGNGIDEVATLA